MSISSHLTPEPERRLWSIMEAMRRQVEWGETKLAALILIAAVEGAFVGVTGPSGAFGRAALAAFGLTLLVAVFALLPLQRTPKWLPFLEPLGEKHIAADSLLSSEALSKLTFTEAIQLLDRYLGGGITATQYHEDLVREAVSFARVAVRKRRLFQVACVLAVLGQLALLGRVLAP